MQPVFIYLGKMVLCSGLFLGYYWIALRNKKFHYYNRFYLLFAALFSLFIPFIHLSSLIFVTKKNFDPALLHYLYESDTLPDVIVRTSHFWDTSTIIFCAVAITSLVFITIFLKSISRIVHLKKELPGLEQDGLTIYNSNLSDAPFSFFHSIFWREDLDIQSSVGAQIFAHELAHIEQKHSLDKVFLQSLCALFWFNPFFWIMQKEMAMIHEFMADEKSVQNQDTQAFAKMLLMAQFGNTILSPINPFAFSPIKRRLVMLTKEQKVRFSFFRRLMILPLLACTTLLFAFRLKEENLPKIDLQNWAKSAGINLTPINNFVGKSLGLKILPDTIIRIKDKTGIRDTTITSPNSSVFLLSDNRKDTHPDNKMKSQKIIVEDVGLAPAQEDGVNQEKLKGRVSGLSLKDTTRVIVVTGRPSANGTPLIVIDGVPNKEGDINTLNPNDIQSITVLKDKNAEAIYGLKARSGVIMITTKQGHANASKSASELNDLMQIPQADREVTVVGFDKNAKDNGIKEARFNGSWREYLERHLRADVPIENKAPGGRNYTVIVSFNVSSTGVISNAHAENNPGYGTAEEAVRIIQNSPPWKPATKNGTPIDCKQRQQITFQVLKN
ncbi:M56 family metallopeptidase [Rhizosphaericola mali]|uniref:TonB-dependent receptor plug domain-containing protein n=1 Tax=Rhizosphaericola mali TaxID=2545455 RepID=A0A5P2G9V9_9BACT|nr:M56 family metallopeptidase [Rhizosphaericola mali]QES90490.1 TonB-dependent receptor plug domain-containing protein [Rhizosphaericola mali]